MMAAAAIELDVARSKLSTMSGQVTAPIWLRVDDLAFPSLNWDDFAVVVLTWWANSLSRMLRGDSDHEIVRFMDGPYLVTVEPTESESWRLRLVEERLIGSVVRVEASVDANALIESVMAAAHEMLSLCRERGWVTDDSQKLARALSELLESRRSS